MVTRPRRLLAAVALFAAAAAAPAADPVVLAEEIRPGDCFQFDISLTVDGKMKVARDGKLEPLPIAAKARHTFAERVEAPDARGGVGVAVRHYSAAASAGRTAGESSARELAADRRLIVAKRTADGSVHYSPAGPLTREELELVAEHFDTLVLPALLPGKEVKPGDTWVVGPEAVQHACHFDGLIKGELVGKLTDVKDGVAAFTVSGPAEGIEFGAHAKLSVSAAGKFDLTHKRIVELTWEQTDDRDQGPASPATELKAVVTVKRTPLAEEPKELSADARAAVPPADKPVPAALTALRYADPNGRYGFAHGRDWHVVGRTRDHLVLRLLDRGEFAAQATITGWKKADPGKPADPAEFQGVIGKLPGWEAEQVLADGEVPTDPGRRLYRVAARGKQDGVAVVQTFYLLTGPTGEQVAVTVVARAEKADKVGTRDVELVNALELPLKK